MQQKTMHEDAISSGPLEAKAASPSCEQPAASMTQAVSTQQEAPLLLGHILSLIGELCEVGDLESGVGPGIRILVSDYRVLTVTGLTIEEVRQCAPLLMSDVQLSVRGAA